ncbi:conserved hypothetical protein [Methanocella paludicola SANAE]|uniref:Glycosyltransferase RgtA/B/C/D-like domain-containing protein n=1 Tax=Methanocella paludicola (strain DSM 17711 / JCM 13418 / NBRC 101707 / SANAE) TaxID=304371 RepID=D1Z2H3_METPS|nr:glycosyltransferase family 39 protein [Methanocella paludicola]BAI62895.1 conserved hypothetical protein [Methanocella paludicola SANAE]
MEHKGLRLSDRAFFLMSAFAYGVVAFGLAACAAWFLQNIWLIGDTKLFYRMAEVILGGGVPYVDFRDPKPPLIFFMLTLPAALGQQLYGGLLLVGLCNFLSAIVVMRIGWKLYGRLPGLVAGLLLLPNLALAEGFFILTEPFALLFILLSVYALLFMKNELLSGIFAGIAIGFKQYALLLVPLLLFYMLRQKELRRAPELLAGVVMPLLIIYGAIFLAYGPDAGASSLYWSFGVADEYLSSSYLGDIPAYKAEDPLVGLANLGLSAGLFIVLLAAAAAGVLLDRPLSPYDELFVLSATAFLATLAVRQYLHYWALALPFVILLCVRLYRKREDRPE